MMMLLTWSSPLHALRENRLINSIHVLRDGEEALEYLFGPCREERLGADRMARPALSE